MIGGKLNIQPDRAAILVLRDTTPLQAARQVNAVVRRQGSAMTWKPIPPDALDAMIEAAELEMEPPVLEFWKKCESVPSNGICRRGATWAAGFGW